MSTIAEAVANNQARLATESAKPFVATAAPSSEMIRIGTFAVGAPAPAATNAVFPTRGTLPQGVILDTDFANAVAMPTGSLRSSALLPVKTVKVSSVSPAASVASAAQPVVTQTSAGTPKQVTNLVVTSTPIKLNGQMVALVTAQWTPGLSDAFYSSAQIWVGRGYHGNPGLQLVASGVSPCTFTLDATGETVAVAAVAMSASGVTAGVAGAPLFGVTLSPTSGTPPAPTLLQSLNAIPAGYQFIFAYEVGLLTNIISCYNIYRNTTANTFAGATLIRAVPQPTSNPTAGYVFQDTVPSLSTIIYYYFVTCVDILGEESTPTAAQSGPVTAITTIDDVPDGSTRFGETAGSITYRPTSNPLTATDAGSNVTVDISLFTMRTAEKGDVVNNSGQITLLSYGTLYYVYYDDPSVVGGAVVYAATTTKVTAIGNSGRFFVESIMTPAATAPDTVGNNDGGVGAQSGFAGVFLYGLTTNAGGTASNPNNAIDGNLVDYAEILIGGSGAVNQSLTLSQCPASAQTWSSLTLKVLLAVPTNEAHCTVTLAYSIDGGTSYTNIFSITGSTRAKTTDTVSLAVNQNPALVLVKITVAKTTGNSDVAQANLYEAWITSIF